MNATKPIDQAKRMREMRDSAAKATEARFARPAIQLVDPDQEAYEAAKLNRFVGDFIDWQIEQS